MPGGVRAWHGALTRLCRVWHFAAWFAATLGAVAVPAARAEPVRVMIAARSDSQVAQWLLEDLKKRNSALPANQRIEVDLHWLGAGDTYPALVRRLAPRLSGYRVVFSSNLSFARELQRQAPQVPLVFQGAADPVQMCLADSLLKPGRSATGYTNYLPEDDVKALETLLDAFSALKVVYVPVSHGNYFVSDCAPRAAPAGSSSAAADRPPCRPGITPPGEYLQALQPSAELLAYARRRSVTLHFTVLCNAGDFARLPVDLGPQVGFLIPWHSLFVLHADALVRRLSLAAGPAIYGRRLFAEKGGLMALEPVEDQWDSRVAIDLFHRVLAGEAPAGIPIQTPRGFRLTLNAPAAHRQGLRPGRLVLRRADEILK